MANHSPERDSVWWPEYSVPYLAFQKQLDLSPLQFLYRSIRRHFYMLSGKKYCYHDSMSRLWIWDGL